MNKVKEFLSPIFIDYGAKNTGVVLMHGLASEPLSEWNKRGLLITAGNGKNYSQTNRRSKRHQKRNIERRLMAKRLLILILKNEYSFSYEQLHKKISPNQTFYEFIMGLLNRRGFTYATDMAQSDEFLLYDFDDFKNKMLKLNIDCIGSSFKEHFARVSNLGTSKIKDILDNDIFDSSLPNDLNIEKDQIKTFKKLISLYRNTLDQICRAEEDGHKPRTKYFEDIKHALKNENEVGQILEDAKIDQDKFLNVICNVSNLQLKVLRKYFNDETFKLGDKWKPEKLDRILNRYIRSVHVNSEEERKNLTSFKSALIKSEGNVLKFLEMTSPDVTIPPFEDQNNRKPQKCQSLLLNVELLNKQFPRWDDWVRRIKNRHNELVLKSDLVDVNKAERILQRFIDRTSKIDEYGLRKIVNKDLGYDTKEQQNLRILLGNEQSKEFISFLKLYYVEVKQARDAIWTAKINNSLLVVCNKTTPARKNVRDLDLARILRVEDKTNLAEQLSNLLEQNPIIFGRYKLKGILEGISDLQKKYHQQLNLYWETCVNSGNQPESINNDDWKLLNSIKNIANLFNEKLGANEEAICNPWSISSIWQIIQDRDGHARNCRFCAEDNFWRIMPNRSNLVGVNATQLPADSARPFDGLIAKLMNDQAEEIANEKINQLQEADAVNATVDIIIEENKFSSTEEMLNFKKDQGFVNRKKKQIELNINNNLKNVNDRLVSREKRLKEFSNKICPYSGSRLLEGGEFDHIYPRSHSLKHFGTVLNHEANLIYVSQRGNQSKKNALYNLNDLNKKFKEHHFPGKSDKAIEIAVINKIDELCSSKRIELQFLLLNQEEQMAVRFGLFIDSCRNKIIRNLIQSNRVRVNGTQKYFVKLINKKLIDKSKNKNINLKINIRFADAFETSSIREHFSKQNEILAKRENQPILSHIIDATIAGLSLYENKLDISLNKQISSADEFEKTLPQDIEVRDLVSKSSSLRYDTFSSEVFKASMYAEKFVPIWLTSQGVGIGFKPDSLIMIPEIKAESFWNLVSLVLIGKNGARVSRNLQDAKNNTISTGCYFNVDKKMYYKLATDTFLVDGVASEIVDCCKLVADLRYFTKKKEFFSLAWPDDAIEPININSIEKKYCTLNVKVLGVEGKIILPLYNDWKMALENLKKKKLPKKPGKELKNEFLKLGHELFNVKKKSRSPVRKVFSLPVLDNPSGGFRLKRESINEKTLFQIQSPHVQARGRLIADHNKFVALPGLISESTIPTEIDSLKVSGDFMSFSNWYEIPLNKQDHKKGIINAKFSLATKDRPDIQLELTFPCFQKLIAKSNSELLNHSIKSEYNKNDHVNLSYLENNLIGAPRDNKFEVINIKNGSITIRFVRSNGSNELKDLAFKTDGTTKKG